VRARARPGQGHLVRAREALVATIVDILDIHSYIREVLLTKTLIDIDEDLLAEAAIAFGTKTKKDTVTAALKEGVERKKRALALARLAARADAGDFDLLLDKENYRR
jgi:Arc/MetJ family transcription regulator